MRQLLDHFNRINLSNEAVYRRISWDGHTSI